jgi:hypothetical protein
MFSSTKQKKVVPKRGDISIEAATNKKRTYDGHKWRRLCSAHDCNKIVQRQHLCIRHSKEFEAQQQLSQNIKSTNDPSKYLPISDFSMTMHDPNDLHNHSKLFTL